MTSVIKKILIELGLNPAYAGFQYLVDAVIMDIDNIKYDLEIPLRSLQEDIAKKKHVTLWSVERRIRTVINRAFENPNEKLLDLFGPYLNEKTQTVGTKCFVKVITIKCIAEKGGEQRDVSR